MRTGELYQRYYGHYLATVVDVDDPQKLGRIRVEADQFTDTQDNPLYASISRPAAGDKQGIFFTPKKGDQVVICFIAGDVRQPMVVGYAHSTQKTPASIVSTEQHGIVTTIGSMIFDEKNGIITVTLVGPTKSVVTMDKDGSKGVKIDFDDGKSTAQLDNDGVKLSFKDSKSTVTLDSNGVKLDVDGKSTVKLESSGITIQSSSKITLKAPDVKVQVDNAMDVS
jgi:uncharacterized protein involved in type VI secretion and phage assembly